PIIPCRDRIPGYVKISRKMRRHRGRERAGGPAEGIRSGRAKNSPVNVGIRDTLGLGTGLWLIGYLSSLVLFFTPYSATMGWILTAIFTPVTIAITWWWFRERTLPLCYYVGVGIAWTLIAVVLDYLFIVRLFQATSYYQPDVFLYYALTFLIPVGVGLYRTYAGREPMKTQG
ncbi:MAG: hypothetical protein LUO86_04345, partial [Methanomicrobiales archaeon]|nr:hypothetical protein [Methanomicrobiales archaeon]